MGTRRSRTPRVVRFRSCPSGPRRRPREAGTQEFDEVDPEEGNAGEDGDDATAILANLTDSDLCFSVEVPQLGAPWDVYRFWHDGRKKHVALRVIQKSEDTQSLEVYFIDQPRVDPETVRKILHARAPS